MLAWTVMDRNGELGCNVGKNRYDAFRLEVASSYRELFDRDLQSVLEDWRKVPLKRRVRRRRRSTEQLELKLN